MFSIFRAQNVFLAILSRFRPRPQAFSASACLKIAKVYLSFEPKITFENVFFLKFSFERRFRRLQKLLEVMKNENGPKMCQNMKKGFYFSLWSSHLSLAQGSFCIIPEYYSTQDVVLNTSYKLSAIRVKRSQMKQYLLLNNWYIFFQMCKLFQASQIFPYAYIRNRDLYR